MPVYKTEVLSGKAVRNIARQVKAYREKLEKQTELFTAELAKVGYDVIRAELLTHTNGVGETLESIEIDFNGEKGTYQAAVRVTSDAIVFLEFGSGLVGLEAPQHPLAAERGLGPGTWPPGPRQHPDYDNWENPEGWMYYDARGKLRTTRGLVASMPMYQGATAMANELLEIAEKVFKK